MLRAQVLAPEPECLLLQLDRLVGAAGSQVGFGKSVRRRERAAMLRA